MHNLIEYGKKYRKTTGSLWSYYKDEPVKLITDSESFKYKTSIIGKTAADGNTKDIEIAVPSKHLSNFWRMLDMPL